MGGFEWDEAKAARNFAEHKVSFEQAAIAWIDDREAYGEERVNLLGLFGREVVFVA